MRSLTVLLLSFVLLVVSGCGGSTTLTPCIGCITQPPAPTKASAVTMTATPATTTPDVNVMLKANVSPSDATGSVLFVDNSTQTNLDREILYGTVSYVKQGFTAGTHVLTAAYTGDSTYVASTSAPVAVSVSVPGATCGLGTSVYVLASGSATQTGQTYTPSTANQSAVCATGPDTSLTLSNPVITGTSFSLADDPAGMGATVLSYAPLGAAAGPAIVINGGSIATAYNNVQSIMATGSGSSVTVSNSAITGSNASGISAHGHVAVAARGGVVTLSNATTSPTYSAGSLFYTQGDGSAINVTGGTWNASDAAAAIEGQSTVTLQNTAISGRGAVRFSNSGINTVVDGSATGTGTFRMTGDSYTHTGDIYQTAFFQVVSGGAANISLTDTTLTDSSTGGGVPQLVNIGGNFTVTSAAVANLSASGSTLVGVVTVDYVSTANITLSNKSAWNGSFQPSNNATFSLTLDASSTWNIQHCTSCVVGTFNDPGGISGTTITNVIGNGNTVTYDKSKNPGLNGLTYTLQNGGTLVPSK